MGMARLHQTGAPAGDVDLGIGEGKVAFGPHLGQDDAVQMGGDVGRVAAAIAAARHRLKRDIVVGRAAREIARQPRRHQRRGDAMARHVQRVDPDAGGIYGEETHQIAADMARGLQQKRDLHRPELAEPFAHQALLQLARLDQVAVDGIVDQPQFGQRLGQQAVVVGQLPLHADDAVPGRDPGAQFIAGDGLGQEIVGAAIKAMGDLRRFGLGGQEDEIGIAFMLLRPKRPAEIQPAEPRHDPVRYDDIGGAFGAKRQRFLDRGGLGHLIAGAGKLRRQDLALDAAVIDDHHAPRRRGGGIGRRGRRIGFGAVSHGCVNRSGPP